MTDTDQKAQSIDPTKDETVRGICFCPAPHHAPYCRIGVMIARLAPPPNLRRISVT